MQRLLLRCTRCHRLLPLQLLPLPLLHHLRDVLLSLLPLPQHVSDLGLCLSLPGLCCEVRSADEMVAADRRRCKSTVRVDGADGVVSSSQHIRHPVGKVGLLRAHVSQNVCDGSTARRLDGHSAAGCAACCGGGVLAPRTRLLMLILMRS